MDKLVVFLLAVLALVEQNLAAALDAALGQSALRAPHEAAQGHVVIRQIRPSWLVALFHYNDLQNNDLAAIRQIRPWWVVIRQIRPSLLALRISLRPR